jgi:hypothetical protein
MNELEIFAVGLIMASTMYPSQIEGPTEDFNLWCVSWDEVNPRWHAAATLLGWNTVGTQWKFHH